MAIRLVFALSAIFWMNTAACQDSKYILQIEKTIATIDSIIATKNNIGDYIQPQFSDEGGAVFLTHHYIIDTSKRILYKATYDYKHFEQVTFYYNNQKFIKAIVSDTSKSNQYKCEYYVDNDSMISIKEHGTSKQSWNKHTISSQAKEYLINFSGICNILDKRK